MGIDDVVDRMGGKQIKQMADLVEDLWRDRKKIIKVVDLVWDNRTEIMGVVAFVEGNKDTLVDLIDRLPSLIGQAGTGLEAAGEGAHRASVLLAGDDGEGPRELTDMAATALERVREQLFELTTLVAELGQGLEAVRLPNRLGDGAARLGDVADDLGGVAGRFRDLGAQLADAGVDLAEVGDKLGGSGATLMSFVDDGGRSPSTTSAPGSRSGRSTSRSSTRSRSSTQSTGRPSARGSTAAQRAAAAKRAAAEKQRALDRKRKAAARERAERRAEADRKAAEKTSTTAGKRKRTSRGGSIAPSTMKPIDDR